MLGHLKQYWVLHSHIWMLAAGDCSPLVSSIAHPGRVDRKGKRRGLDFALFPPLRLLKSEQGQFQREGKKWSDLCPPAALQVNKLCGFIASEV